MSLCSPLGADCFVFYPNWPLKKKTRRQHISTPHHVDVMFFHSFLATLSAWPQKEWYSWSTNNSPCSVHFIQCVHWIIFETEIFIYFIYVIFLSGNSTCTNMHHVLNHVLYFDHSICWMNCISTNISTNISSILINKGKRIGTQKYSLIKQQQRNTL